MITIEDLGIAYRKAKVDLYYSSHASLAKIADYEDNLYDNLKALLAKIKGKDTTWVTNPNFLGGWMLATKSIDISCFDEYRDKQDNGFIFSSPADEWEHKCRLLANNQKVKKPKAEFRVMADCSMDFHVLSTLWMLKVGHLFDAKLSSCAYGNRLRRTKDGSVNEKSLGTFQPYLKPFRTWREKGISTMRTALEEDKNIVAITADVSSFYHELNPDFMLNTEFLVNVIGIRLKKSDSKLHDLFIQSLKKWAENTPLKKGLPVGLPASALVANVALIELDQIIEKELTPLYYGRYVDDILLVMKNGTKFESSDKLWKWIFARFEDKLEWSKDTDNKSRKIRFKPEYLSNSSIQFANSKNKIFILAGESGKALVDAISYQIHERASEWRSMPRLPKSASHIATTLLAATQKDGEAADNLRKADALTMRRAGFAIKLRDFEAYERDLCPESWQAHRQAFLDAFIQHVLVLPHFFDLSVYLPRVIRLATACEDFESLKKIIDAIINICTQVEKTCEIKIKAYKLDKKSPELNLLLIWRKQLANSLFESAFSNLKCTNLKRTKLHR